MNDYHQILEYAIKGRSTDLKTKNFDSRLTKPLLKKKKNTSQKDTRGEMECVKYFYRYLKKTNNKQIKRKKLIDMRVFWRIVLVNQNVTKIYGALSLIRVSIKK